MKHGEDPPRTRGVYRLDSPACWQPSCSWGWTGRFVPPWQSPDEVAHFGYTESLTVRHASPGKKGLGEISTDQLQADSAVGASRGAFYPASLPPSWSPQVFRAFVATSPRFSRTDGGRPNSASTNPPQYYLYAAVAYLADIGGNAFGRLYAVRIWGILLWS